MSQDMVASLAGNAGLLLALTVLYDAVGLREEGPRQVLLEVLDGLFLGAIGVAVMLVPLRIAPGVIVDSRSVVLSLGALFLGTVPAVVAVLVAGAYRLALGGPGAATGLAVIVLSAAIGLAWRQLRRRRLALWSFVELYLFGVVVHLGMLSCTLLLPERLRGATFATIALPVMAVSPAATALVGWVLRSGHARRMAERADRRVVEILESMGDGFVALDRNWRYTYINAQGAALFDRTPEDLIGKHIWTEFPEGVGQPFHLNYERAVREQTPVFFEGYYEPWDRWFENRVFPSPDGLAIFYHDITDRKRAEQAAARAAARLETLHELDGAILEARTVAEIATAALQRLRDLVSAARASLAVFDEEVGEAEVFAAGVLEEELGGSQRVPLAEAFPDLEALRAGTVVRLDDLAAAADGAGAVLTRLRDAGIKSAINVPLRTHGVLLGSLNLGSTRVRGFSDDDIEVAREVADSLAIAIEKARLDEAVARHAQELEARVAERTAELAARTAEAERLNRAMLNLLEDLRAQQRQAGELARRLEISNRELEAFAYSVSHDLRAPLRAIDGFGEALAEELAGRLDERQQHDLDRMRAAARRMGTMIDHLLRLSRASRVDMELRRVDLSALALEVVAELRAAEPERRVEVTVAAGLTAHGDPRLLHLVLQNLIGNAWKFTRPKEAARIEVGRYEDAGEGVFFVRDNGVGFHMKHADKLFGAFQRLHRRDEFPGEGIGLATVQRIVARHGGRVWAEAKPGAGATFYFTLDEGENA